MQRYRRRCRGTAGLSWHDETAENQTIPPRFDRGSLSLYNIALSLSRSRALSLSPYQVCATYNCSQSSTLLTMASRKQGHRRRILAVAWAACALVGILSSVATTANARKSSSSSSSSGRGGGGNNSGSDSSSGSGRTHRSREKPQGKIRAAWAGSSRADAAFPLSHLHFCLGCQDPAAEGSLGMCQSQRLGSIVVDLHVTAVARR